MSKTTIKNDNEFEKIIRDLERTIPAIEDAFELQNRNFRMIDGTDNYRGKCQQAISEKYNEVKSNYETIDEALINYIKFLKLTLNNYRHYEATLNRSLDENSENLDVNHN